jgi:ATP-binding cassette subfamily C protein CydD
MAFQPALLILILAPEFYLPLRMLGLRFHAAASGVSAAKRLFEILAQPLPETGMAGSALAAAMPPAAPLQIARVRQADVPWARLEFQEVHFAYPGGRSALCGVSFDIPARQMTALVGPSGAGKSTIAQLLLRFVEPERGKILVDGQPLRQLEPAAWRDRLAWVPQTPHLFHDTVAANLRVARPEASDEDLERAARQACLHDFILSLPLGYDTVVGEAGARLSGGQAQRLAVARAFLKDAPFLIMDEPTSRVDPELEAVLQGAVAQLMQGRTTLVIAHRLNTVYRADQIVVLAEGQVAEQGWHAALARRGGYYYQLLTAGIP